MAVSVDIDEKWRVRGFYAFTGLHLMSLLFCTHSFVHCETDSSVHYSWSICFAKENVWFFWVTIAHPGTKCCDKNLFLQGIYHSALIFFRCCLLSATLGQCIAQKKMCDFVVDLS